MTSHTDRQRRGLSSSRDPAAMATVAPASFHLYADTLLARDAPLFPFPPLLRVDGTHTAASDRRVSYRVHPHFHPYADALMTQLMRGSVRGLQDADTEFALNPDGTIKALADSASAVTSSEASLVDGRRLAKGARIKILDGAVIRFEGQAIVLPGHIAWADTPSLVAFSGGGPGTDPAIPWHGIWSTSWNTASQSKMWLKQDYDVVTGSYIQPEGRILARAAGNRLEGQWIQDNGRGFFRFLLGPEGQSFTGRWGRTAGLSNGDWGGARQEGSKVLIPFGSKAELSRYTLISLSDGTTAAVDSDVEITFEGCAPRPKLYASLFFEQVYNPTPIVEKPYPVKDLDFTYSGAYSSYNWELFFHVPLTIAINLSRNQRFEEAMRWFHFVFDPTDDSDGSTPERFWKVKPFQVTDVKSIEQILVNLSTGSDALLREETISAIAAWKDLPFRPHLVARYRHSAYMHKAVMAYLDNLIAWGDALFREDTGEAVNEALQLYVLVANILGPRPQVVPRQSAAPQTYASLRRDLNQFGNALVALESDIPFDSLPLSGEGGALDQFSATLRSIGRSLYFCVPRNDKVLAYWDTLADRLFKIRNSLNFQGAFRQLPLFDPPIDPGLLAKAAAAGLDIAAVVSASNQALPLVRFPILAQRAAELAQEVKLLGANLLAAMEKEDAKSLALLRLKHEREILAKVEGIRYGQHQEARKTTEAAYRSLALALQRYRYFERQLAAETDWNTTFSFMSDLDIEDLRQMKLAVNEPEWMLRPIEVDIAPDLEEFARQDHQQPREARA